MSVYFQRHALAVPMYGCPRVRYSHHASFLPSFVLDVGELVGVVVPGGFPGRRGLGKVAGVDHNPLKARPTLVRKPNKSRRKQLLLQVKSILNLSIYSGLTNFDPNLSRKNIIIKIKLIRRANVFGTTLGIVAGRVISREKNKIAGYTLL